MKSFIFLSISFLGLMLCACSCDNVEPTDPKFAELSVVSIDGPIVDCPGGSGTCVTTVIVTITNSGDGPAGPFNVETTFDPAASVVVTQTIAGLADGAVMNLSFTTPAGGNCYDPDCRITVIVDSSDVIAEPDETNNEMSRNFVG